MGYQFRTYDLAVQFARACRVVHVPEDLKSQLFRASSSIPLNLNEGAARHMPKDRYRFYRIALGSFRECEAIFDIIDSKDLLISDLRKKLGGSLCRLCLALSKTKK